MRFDDIMCKRLRSEILIGQYTQARRKEGNKGCGGERGGAGEKEKERRGRKKGCGERKEGREERVQEEKNHEEREGVKESRYGETQRTKRTQKEKYRQNDMKLKRRKYNHIDKIQ